MRLNWVYGLLVCAVKCQGLLAQSALEVESQEIRKSLELELQKAVKLPSPIEKPWADTQTRHYPLAVSGFQYPMRYRVEGLKSPEIPHRSSAQLPSNYLRAGGGIIHSFTVAGLVQQSINPKWNAALKYEGEGAIYTRVNHNPYHWHQADMYVQTSQFNSGNLEAMSSWNLNSFSLMDTLQGSLHIPESYQVKNAMTRHSLHIKWQGVLQNNRAVHYSLHSRIMFFDHRNRRADERYVNLGGSLSVPLKNLKWLSDLQASLGFSPQEETHKQQHHFLEFRSGTAYQSERFQLQILPGILLSRKDIRFYPEVVFLSKLGQRALPWGIEWKSEFNRHSYECWTRINPYIHYIAADSQYHFRHEVALLAKREAGQHKLTWKARFLYRNERQAISFLPYEGDPRRSQIVIQDMESVGVQSSVHYTASKQWQFSIDCEKSVFFENKLPWQLPLWFGIFRANWQLDGGRWAINPWLDISGKRVWLDERGQRMKSTTYIGFHLHQTYRLGKFFNVFIDINNLFNNRQVLWYIQPQTSYLREAQQLLGGFYVKW